VGGLTRPVLTTARLRLEPVTEAHTEHLVALCADPRVMRYITGRALARAEVVGEWLPRWTAAWTRGLGHWAAFEQDRFAGLYILRPEADRPIAELGWRTPAAAWGRGLAAEAATALVELGWERGLTRVTAETMAVNTASVRVMQGLGMRPVDTYVGEWSDPIPGSEQGEVVYALDAATWAARREWDAEAASFDEPADHGLRDPAVRAAWRDLLLAAMPPAPARVADLGCGTGTLSLLLADEGYAVDGVDLSPEMVRLARAKAGDRSGVGFAVGDASAPALPESAYDVVLCRHLLWALPDPVAALRRWAALLRPGGRIVLVEGFWWNRAGLRAADTLRLLEEVGWAGEVIRLDDPAYWGRAIDDERYLIVASSSPA
jgi:RimJ/RimL family protein N-acetyltransferase/protein-L-isoaspartate O-methyltransferase